MKDKRLSLFQRAKKILLKEEQSLESPEITVKDTILVATISIFLIPFFLLYKVGIRLRGNKIMPKKIN